MMTRCEVRVELVAGGWMGLYSLTLTIAGAAIDERVCSQNIGQHTSIMWCILSRDTESRMFSECSIEVSTNLLGQRTFTSHKSGVHTSVLGHISITAQ